MTTQIPSIAHEIEYLEYIRSKGVGDNDRVGSSPQSYLTYLRSISKHLGIKISPLTIRGESDVKRIATALRGKLKDKTIANYTVALKHYASFGRERRR